MDLSTENEQRRDRYETPISDLKRAEELGRKTTLNNLSYLSFSSPLFHFPRQAALKEGDRLQDYVSGF